MNYHSLRGKVVVPILTLVLTGLWSPDSPALDAAEALRQSLASMLPADRELPDDLAFSGTGEAFGFPATFDAVATVHGDVALSVKTVQYNLYRVTGKSGGWERQSWQNLGEDPAAAVRQLGPRAISRIRPWVLYALAEYARTPEQCRPAALENAGDTPVIGIECGRGAKVDTFVLDAQTLLPLQYRYTGLYPQGEKPVTEYYSDYRKTGDYTLPFTMRLPGPELPDTNMHVEVTAYSLANDTESADFAYPHEKQMNRPYGVTLQNVPFGVYKEADWIQGGSQWDQNSRWSTVFAPTETWTFDMLVDERYGRWLTPVSARVKMLAGAETVSEVRLGEATLEKLRRRNLSRYSGLAGIFVLRHHFTAPVDVAVDAMQYRLTLVSPGGEEVIAERRIPVSVYDQKTELIFPVRGPFIVTSGHDWDDINHKDEWQQWGAYDIVPLDDNLAVFNGAESFIESFHAFGREVLAPAAGRVVYARDGVPDDKPDDFWEKTDLPRDVWALPGNVIIIDHGNDEFSFFAHLMNGELRVKKGDRVSQGDTIALLGASNGGLPHLHYQLMAGPVLLRSDGLPAAFTNVKPAVYPGPQIRMPKRGFYLYAD